MASDPIVAARVSPSLERVIRQYENERGINRTEAVNELLGAGLARRAAGPDDCSTEGAT
jgi:hypothetical protein